MIELLSKLGIEINAHILLYIVIAGGLTELLIDFSPKRFTRRKFGALLSLSIAILAAIIGGRIQGIGFLKSFFNGLIAAALASAGFDYLKTIKQAVRKQLGGSNVAENQKEEFPDSHC